MNGADRHVVETKLLERAQAGSTADFDELADMYMDRAYAFALRLSGDADAAADAIQDAFFKAWKNIRRFDPARSFQPWLFTIVRNAVYDLMRKRREIGFSRLSTGSAGDDGAGGEFGEDLASDESGAEEEFDRAVESKTLEEALKHLTSDQRAAVLLHDVEGMTFEEIGAVTGRPMNTEKSHYRRAIIKLRSIIVEQMSGGVDGRV